MTTQNCLRRTPWMEEHLREEFMNEVDNMSYEELRFALKACVWNLKEATEFINESEKIVKIYENEKSTLQDQNKNLKIQLQQYREKQGNHLDEMIKLQKQSQEYIERLATSTSCGWHLDAISKRNEFSQDVVLYQQNINKDLLKIIGDLKQKLESRTQQWQVTLNLYLKERLENGEGLTILEKIAKEKYLSLQLERSKKE